VSIAVAALALACGQPAAERDLATPKTTVTTLLRAHRLDRASADEVRRRMTARDSDHGHAIDQALAARCFEDFDPHDPVDHGLQGFVVGALAAGRDQLEVRIDGETATVTPGPSSRVVLHRHPDGWKISLADSVPAGTRERMQALWKRAQR